MKKINKNIRELYFSSASALDSDDDVFPYKELELHRVIIMWFLFDADPQNIDEMDADVWNIYNAMVSVSTEE